jgi:hypothetical protein
MVSYLGLSMVEKKRPVPEILAEVRIERLFHA